MKKAPQVRGLGWGPLPGLCSPYAWGMDNSPHTGKRDHWAWTKSRVGKAVVTFGLGVTLYIIGGLWGTAAGGLSPDNELIAVQGLIAVTGAILCTSVILKFINRT